MIVAIGLLTTTMSTTYVLLLAPSKDVKIPLRRNLVTVYIATL